jgi:hypothetical protein
MHTDRDETYYYKNRRDSYDFKERQHQRDLYLGQEVEHRHWPHPERAISIKETETSEESTISAYTDGSKSEEVVGVGAVLYNLSHTIASLKQKLANRCSNNQAELIGIY